MTQRAGTEGAELPPGRATTCLSETGRVPSPGARRAAVSPLGQSASSGFCSPAGGGGGHPRCVRAAAHSPIGQARPGGGTRAASVIGQYRARAPPPAPGCGGETLRRVGGCRGSQRVAACLNRGCGLGWPGSLQPFPPSLRLLPASPFPSVPTSRRRSEVGWIAPCFQFGVLRRCPQTVTFGVTLTGFRGTHSPLLPRPLRSLTLPSGPAPPELHPAPPAVTG